MSKERPTNKQLIQKVNFLIHRNELLTALLCKRSGGQTTVTQDELTELIGYRIFTKKIDENTTAFKIEKEETK